MRLVQEKDSRAAESLERVIRQPGFFIIRKEAMKRMKAQTLTEYFLILLLMAALTAIGASAFYKTVQIAGQNYAHSKITSMVGK